MAWKLPGPHLSSTLHLNTTMTTGTYHWPLLFTWILEILTQASGMWDKQFTNRDVCQSFLDFSKDSLKDITNAPPNQINIMQVSCPATSVAQNANRLSLDSFTWIKHVSFVVALQSDRSPFSHVDCLRGWLTPQFNLSYYSLTNTDEMDQFCSFLGSGQALCETQFLTHG